LRRDEVSPRLSAARAESIMRFDAGGVCASWSLGEGSALLLFANLAAERAEGVPYEPRGRLLFATEETVERCLSRRELPPWSVAWFLA
jgi:hypothetical protein